MSSGYLYHLKVSLVNWSLFSKIYKILKPNTFVKIWIYLSKYFQMKIYKVSNIVQESFDSFLLMGGTA